MINLTILCIKHQILIPAKSSPRLRFILTMRYIFSRMKFWILEFGFSLYSLICCIACIIIHSGRLNHWIESFEYFLWIHVDLHVYSEEMQSCWSWSTDSISNNNSGNYIFVHYWTDQKYYKPKLRTRRTKHIFGNYSIFRKLYLVALLDGPMILQTKAPYGQNKDCTSII